jgi:fatty acid desaturase
MNEQIKITWYRCKVDKKLMSELMKPSDFRGLCQVIPQIALYFVSGLLAYLAYFNIHRDNWVWAVPVLIVALYIHGMFGGFMGLGGPVHELCHKTPFRTKWLNEFFLRFYSFISWSDYISFRPSHVKHHQVTLHVGHDYEVVLPQKFDWYAVRFYMGMFACDLKGLFDNMRGWGRAARGNESDWKTKGEWMNKLVPESNLAMRREHRLWARFVLGGHLALAILFVATGNWILLIIFTFGCFYCGWLTGFCGTPQHIGLSSNVPDFRLCCRTYTCNWFPGFLYWNMQYHIEHHMFPAVPFYNLPRLHEAIKHDLPPTPNGLWNCWKELLPIIIKQREDPNYIFVPKLPQNVGDVANDEILELEAATPATRLAAF